jgi:hypothetical protein
MESMLSQNPLQLKPTVKINITIYIFKHTLLHKAEKAEASAIVVFHSRIFNSKKPYARLRSTPPNEEDREKTKEKTEQTEEPAGCSHLPSKLNVH